MAIALEDIGTEVCEPTGGLSKVYYAPFGDFDTIVDPKDICGTVPATSFAELIEIPASPGHEMKTGKQLFQLKMVTETGTITHKMIGEKKRRLFENEMKLELSGSSSDLLGFLRWVKNQDLVFFTEEFGSGQIRQFGSSRLPSWMEGIDAAIEAAIEGKNAVTLTVKDKQKWPCPIYKGDLQLTPVV